MKLFYSIKLVILSIMMCCPELVMAQAARPLTRQEIDAVLNPSLLEGAEKIVQFEETVVNIGEMTEDDKPVETNFYFKNIVLSLWSLPDCIQTVVVLLPKLINLTCSQGRKPASV